MSDLIHFFLQNILATYILSNKNLFSPPLVNPRATRSFIFGTLWSLLLNSLIICELRSTLLLLLFDQWKHLFVNNNHRLFGLTLPGSHLYLSELISVSLTWMLDSLFWGSSCYCLRFWLSGVGVVRVQCTCSFSLLLAAAHLWFTCIREVFKRTSHLFSEWCTPQALNLPRESLKPAPSNTSQHVFFWKRCLLQTRTEMKVTYEHRPSVTPVVINACLRFIHSLG